VNVVSSTPTAVVDAVRAGSSTSGVPWRRTAFMAAAHDTPNLRPAAATEVPSPPTDRQISTAALVVSSPPGLTAGNCTVHAAVGQSPSGQRQTLFDQHNTTGRPDTGRSRTFTRRRP
jgi:hypothetical protein